MGLTQTEGSDSLPFKRKDILIEWRFPSKEKTKVIQFLREPKRLKHKCKLHFQQVDSLWILMFDLRKELTFGIWDTVVRRPHKHPSIVFICVLGSTWGKMNYFEYDSFLFIFQVNTSKILCFCIIAAKNRGARKQKGSLWKTAEHLVVDEGYCCKHGRVALTLFFFFFPFFPFFYYY